jgi:endonuclease III
VSLPAFLQKIVDWLRAGYPHGVPEVDYVPLFALLARRLSLEEVDQVTTAMVAESLIHDTVTEEQIRDAISAVTEQPALESDVQRIEEHLASVGWVVAAPASSEE